MEAITAATNHLSSKYLNECTLYVTLEPCVMCAGALFWSQIGRVVAGASDPKRGYTLHGPLLHPKTSWSMGLLHDECGSLMTSFFQSLRHG
jgi:tRNA(adenine34) deaminase